MRVRVVKGGWSWLGVERHAGELLEAPSDAWIDNRIADGGLVERLDDPPIAAVVIETAMLEPPETAVRPRASAKPEKPKG